MLRCAFLAAVVALLCGCVGTMPTDASAGQDGADVGADVLEVLNIDRADATGGDAADLGQLDVAQVPLPGRWRLVGWNRTGAAGAEMYTDQEEAASGGSARVNGVMWLQSQRIAQSYGLLLNGHFAIDPLGNDDSAIAAFSNVSAGTLGDASFAPASGGSVDFVSNADGTIRQMATAGAYGTVQLTWERDDVPVQQTQISGQSMVVQLRATMSQPMASPRATLAWDRPGHGYTLGDDRPLLFVPPGVAAYGVSASSPPDNAVSQFDGISVAVAYLLVYDDRNGDGVYDALASGTESDAGLPQDAGSGDASSMDGGPIPGDVDVLRGVSPIAIAFRSAGMLSDRFEQAALRDLSPGLQFALVRADPTVAGGMSLGPFDQSHPVTPDAVVEVSVASEPVPDLIP